MAHENEHIKPTAGSSLLLVRLKEYKEIIGITVFFLAGLMWIYGFFATKDQLKVQKCISDTSVMMLEGKMDIEFKMDKYAQTSMELINKIEKDGTSNEEDSVGIGLDQETTKARIRLSKELELLGNEINEAKAKFDEALYILKTYKCQDL